MSLQVWLPLNGSLQNQGLSNLTFSTISTDTSVSTSGKIGKCYSNNGWTVGGIISSEKIDLGQKQSMFCWMKFSTLNSNSSLGAGLVSQHRYPTNTGMGITIKYVSNTTGYISVNTGTGSDRTFNTYCGKTLLSANTWYHVGYTYDGSTIKLYINGVLDGTHSFNGMSVPADYITVFCWSTDNSNGDSAVHYNYKLNGSLNDVRIYDHCLSAKEVKEISKGLILHYKLDNNSLGLPNLVTNSQRLSNLFSTAGTSLWSRTYTDENGTSVWTATCTTAGTGGVHTPLFSKTSDKIGKQYTWSCRIKANKNVSITVGSECGGIKRQDVTTEWQYITHTWTFTDSTYESFVWYIAEGSWAVGDWIKVRDLKIEEGNKATPWIPHTSDAEYTQLGLKSNVEYDCSGYGYHGTKYGNISISNSSCRYDISYNFSNTNSYIVAPAINPTDFSNSFSFSWWGNLPDYKNKMMWGFADGNRLNLYSGIYNNTGDGYDNPFYSSGTTVINVPSVNTWHHFVLVGDGSTSKLYMDGNLYGTAKTYKAVTGYQIYISGWNAQTEYKCEGLVSDFRYYATALSATDVKELYNTSASIDKSGNIYAYGYKEE